MKYNDKKPHSNVDYFKNLTADISKKDAIQKEEIGQKLRTIRKEKGVSLEELSKLTGFETDFLSKIETDVIQPQIGTVIKLSKALESAFGRLVSGVGDKLYSITRKNERTRVARSTSEGGVKQVYTYMSLAPEVKGRHMEALIVQLEENPDSEMSVHDGEEFIYVLDGIVTLTIGGDSFELEVGDSVYYLSTTPHLIAAKKDRATVLAVLYDR